MLNKAKNIFIVGIKGVAMANLALILKKMGKNVTGSDVSEEFITDELLRKNKIRYTIGFNPDDLPKNTDTIIYSAAHRGTDNPQTKEGQRRGIKIQSQPEVLGQLSKQFKTTIAVCGCHGKTTTTSLLAYSLIKLGVKPSYLVGSPSLDGYDGGNYHTTVHGSYFVVEADEYGVNPPLDKTPKFHFLHPDYIVCTNIDFDHPDVYRNIEEVKKAFFNFFNGHKLILCTDDLLNVQLIKRLDTKKIQTYGFNKDADLKIGNIRINELGSSFDLCYKTKHLGECLLPLFGKKNILNTTGVVLTLLNLGFSFEKIKKALVGFTGAKRRFEKIAFINDIYLFDDYGHHPAEIEATIQAARSRFPQRRIVVIFQPHTFSRTQVLKSEFALSLSLADLSIVLDIFSSARERKEDFKVNSLDIEKIAKEYNKNNVAYIRKNKLLNFLAKNLKKGDVVFTMGAGDVYKLKDDIIEVMKKIV